MNSTRTQEQHLLQAALALESEAQREAFLNAACANDPALRRRIDALIAASGEAEAFFQEDTEKHAGLMASATDPTAGVHQPPQEPHTVFSANLLTEAPGTVIGRYKLREKIGEGGCGVVYVAEQEEPVRRKVALKVIKLGMDTRNVVARFNAERQALAMMDHPNIAKVLDAGATESGRPYFVMELVRGIRITDYCDQNNLSPRERLGLFIKVCQAIQHAHQKGIIHRDIKPSNILVTLHDGVPVPKVIDFGIAKATEGRLTDLTVYTELHQFIGTPAYMSPEQAEMSGLDIDTRSDIYSLGVLLYELLTGKTPFDAQELIEAGLDELRRTIREKEPVRPSTRLSTMLEGDLTTTAKHRASDAVKLIHLLRGDLDWIVMKALEKDRTRRYDTANGLAMDIQRHLSNEAVVARPPSAAYRFQKLVRRNKLAFGAATAVAATLVFGIVVSSWQAIRAEHERRVAITAEQNEAKQRQAAEEQRKIAVEQRKTAEEQTGIAVAQRRDLRRQLYVGDMSKAFHAIKEGNLALATRLMRDYFDQPEGEDLRGWEWRYLWQLCQPSEHRILPNIGQVTKCAIFSPDGMLLAAAGLDQTVRVIEVTSNKAVTNLTGFDGEIDSRALTFSRDGRLLAAKGGHIVRAWNTETWQEVFHETIALPKWNELDAVLFSPDGKTLATRMKTTGTETAPARKGVGFWDIQSGRFLTMLDSPDVGLGAADGGLGTVMAYSPGGDLLVLSDLNVLRVLDARSLKPISNLIHTNAFGWEYSFRVMSIAFSGNLMAAGYRLGEIKIWDTKNWAELASWRAHPSFVLGLDFSPDGKLLASGGTDCRIQVWDVATVLKAGTNATAIPPQTTLNGHTNQIGSVMFAPDGRSIVSCSMDRTVRLWSLPSPDRTIPLFEAKPADDKNDWWFLEDGKHAVFADQNFQLFLADLSGATPPQPVKTPKGYILDRFKLMFGYEDGMEVSPDGKTMAVRKGADGSVQLWNLETAEPKTTIPPIRPGTKKIAFAQGGPLLIISYSGEIRIRDLSGKRDELVLTTSIQDVDSGDLVLSAGGGVLAARLSTQIGFWSLPDGRSLGAIDVPRSSGPERFTLSQDGRWLAYRSWPESSPVLWDLTSRQSRKIPMNDVTSTWGNMAFAPDGKTLVFVTDGGTLGFWNLATGGEIITEENLAGNYSGAKFSANGEYLALPLTLRRAPPLAEIEAKERAKAEDGFGAAKKARK